MYVIWGLVTSRNVTFIRNFSFVLYQIKMDDILFHYGKKVYIIAGLDRFIVIL